MEKGNDRSWIESNDKNFVTAYNNKKLNSTILSKIMYEYTSLAIVVKLQRLLTMCAWLFIKPSLVWHRAKSSVRIELTSEFANHYITI